MALKWGFACAGKIAHDYLNAMTTLPEGHHEVVAIADPMVHQAEELAERYNIPKYYASFLELAKDPNVEVVHVASLNPYHLEVSLLMLEHGKHVLCQKPLCMNEKQARKLIEYAEKKKLFLMEGFWSRSNPSYQYIREQLQAGRLGDIKSVEVDFTNPHMASVERAV